MKMKKIFFILFSSFLLVSCGDARFNGVPGVYQDVIPSEIHGNYRFYNAYVHSQKFDSLLISIDQYEIKLSTNAETLSKRIHQDFQMTKIKDLILIGTPDKTFNALWNLTVIQPTYNGIKVYFINSNVVTKNEPSHLSKYLQVNELMFHHEPINNQPTPVDGGNQIQAGPLGENRIAYYNANADEFRQYFDAEIKDKDYVFIPRERGMKRRR